MPTQQKGFTSAMPSQEKASVATRPISVKCWYGDISAVMTMYIDLDATTLNHVRARAVRCAPGQMFLPCHALWGINYSTLAHSITIPGRWFSPDRQFESGKPEDVTAMDQSLKQLGVGVGATLILHIST